MLPDMVLNPPSVAWREPGEDAKKHNLRRIYDRHHPRTHRGRRRAVDVISDLGTGAIEGRV
jgi:hypothetical protein